MSEIVVLFVEPGPATRSIPPELADSPDLNVVDSASLEAAKETLAERNPDCLVTEYDLSDGTGIDLIRHVRETDPSTGCILFTDTDRETITEQLDDSVVMDFVNRETPEAGQRLRQLVSTTARFRTQTSYPLPENEPERLAVLERLELHSDSIVRAFERIAELAAGHFDVDRATVNVIEADSQEVLASYGTDWTRVPREETICTYSILDDDVSVVGDIDDDPRFASNETLSDLSIRFYAGAPLTTDDGLPIGTICIYDETPRDLTDDGRRYLRLLADETMHLITLHSRLARRQVAAGSEVDD